MKLLKTTMLAAIAVLFSMTANAAPIAYTGTLTSGVTTGGFISDVDTDWWRFTLTEAATVSITVNRLFADLDPAYRLYSGADDTANLNLVGSQDDNIAELPGFDGPYSDPYGVFQLVAGSYSVEVWDFASSSQPQGGACYQITLNGSPSQQLFGCGQNEVPEPGSLALLALGLAGAGFLRRRKSV